MAKTELRFLDNDGKGSFARVELYENQIYIDIYDSDGGDYKFIRLDKSTAIKLAKTLRTEINKLT